MACWRACWPLTNSHRMRYKHFRALGMFVGSGTVEAGCKAIIGQRLKLSGMRWNIPGATGLAALRCQQASNRWEQIWQRPHNQTPLTSLEDTQADLATHKTGSHPASGVSLPSQPALATGPSGAARRVGAGWIFPAQPGRGC
jgi:hypothetical protein